MKANGRDRCRGMSAEDEMMFKLGRPFEDDVSKSGLLNLWRKCMHWCSS